MPILTHSLPLAALFFTLGLFLARTYSLTTPFVLFGFIVSLLLVVGFRHRKMVSFFFLTLSLSMGLVSGLRVSSEEIRRNLPTNQWCELTGVQSTFLTRKKRNNRYFYEFQMNKPTLRCEAREIPLSTDVIVRSFSLTDLPEIGDELSIWGRVSSPKRASNQAQFDYAQFLRGKGVDLIVYSFKQDHLRKRGERLYYRPLRWIGTYRERVRSRLDELFSDGTTNALMHALLLGERGMISQETREVLIKTGTVHLLAISGLHMSLLCFLLLSFMRLLRIPIRLALLLAAGLLILYAFFSGLHIPVLRALLLVLFYAISQWLGEERNLMSVLSVAYMGLLMLNPNFIDQVAFQLSFAAVSSILLICPIYLRGENQVGIFPYFYSILIASFAAMVGTTPILTTYFNLISTVDMLSNMIAIPVVTGVLAMGLVLLPLVAIEVSWVMWLTPPVVWAIDGLLYALRKMAALRYSVLSAKSPSLIMLAVYYVLVLTLIFCGNRGKRLNRVSRYGLVFLFALFSCLITQITPLSLAQAKDKTVFTVFALKQSLSVFIERDGSHFTLIATGRGHPSYEMKWVIEPYLRSRALQRLDELILIDSHANSTGGVRRVMAEFTPQLILAPPEREKKRKQIFGRKKVLTLKENERINEHLSYTGDGLLWQSKTLCVHIYKLSESLGCEKNILITTSDVEQGGDSVVIVAGVESRGKSQVVSTQERGMIRLRVERENYDIDYFT